MSVLFNNSPPPFYSSQCIILLHLTTSFDLFALSICPSYWKLSGCLFTATWKAESVQTAIISSKQTTRHHGCTNNCNYILFPFFPVLHSSFSSVVLISLLLSPLPCTLSPSVSLSSHLSWTVSSCTFPFGHTRCHVKSNKQFHMIKSDHTQQQTTELRSV